VGLRNDDLEADVIKSDAFGEQGEIGRNVTVSFRIRNRFERYDPEGRKSRGGAKNRGRVGTAGSGIWQRVFGDDPPRNEEDSYEVANRRPNGPDEASAGR
jgi:hypothetical protein